MGWGRQTVVKGYLPYLIYKLDSECGDSSVPGGIGVGAERVCIGRWSLGRDVNVNVNVMFDVGFTSDPQALGLLGLASGY